MRILQLLYEIVVKSQQNEYLKPAFSPKYKPACIMAEIVQVPANVKMTSGVAAQGTSGEVVNAGDHVYKKAADAKLYQAENDVDAASADVIGVALANTPGADQPLAYALPGAVINPGATLGLSDVYVLSSTAGRMELDSDVAAEDTEYKTFVGVAKSTTEYIFQPTASGVKKP